MGKFKRNKRKFKILIDIESVIDSTYIFYTKSHYRKLKRTQPDLIKNIKISIDGQYYEIIKTN